MRDLHADDIRRGAATIRDRRADATVGDLDWWRDTVLIDRELRRRRRSREATAAARDAVAALRWAARLQGMASDDRDVECVAETVRVMARAAVAGRAEILTGQALSPSWFATRRSA